MTISRKLLLFICNCYNAAVGDLFLFAYLSQFQHVHTSELLDIIVFLINFNCCR